jgi:autotransporter passenger strand-loop-strand repeat protein
MKMTDATVSSATSQYIYDRGVANSCAVLSGGTQHVSSGGVASSCEIYGFEYVYSGALTYSTVVERTGFQFVQSHGTAVGTVLSGGTQQVDLNGVVTSTLLGASARMVVRRGGSAADVHLSGYFSFLTASSAWVSRVTNTSLCYVYAFGGGIIEDVTLTSAAFAFISSGGLISGLDLHGTLTVSSGGVANSTTVDSGGSMIVSSGGTASGCVLSGGTLTVSSGGTGENAMIYSGGSTHVYGTLSDVSALEMTANIVLYSGGTVSNAYLPLGNLLVSSGGFADGVVVSGVAPTSRGTLNIRAGGSADHVSALRYENIYVNGYITNLFIRGAAYIRSPGVASGVDLSGTLVVSSGASALAVTSNAGATVIVAEGGYIEYAQG